MTNAQRARNLESVRRYREANPMNIFDRLLGIILPDDRRQPKAPVFACPLVVQRDPPNPARWGNGYRVARQQASGELVGAGPWRSTMAAAEADLEAIQKECGE